MVIDYFKLYLNYPGKQGAFFRSQYDALWPLLRSCAGTYRKIFLKRTRFIVVIGSLGKTTTKRALDRVLIDKRRYQSFSNYGSCLAENIMRGRHTDPYEVLEVGIDHPGEMRPMAKIIRPDIVVVTSIKSDHNRSFPSLKDTREEKEHMVKELSSDGIAVLNGDDPNVMWMASRTNAKIKTFGINKDNDVYASEVRLNWPKGMLFKLHAGNEVREVSSLLIGNHMVYPLLAAVTVGLAEGMVLDEIIGRLQCLTPTSARLEPILLPSGAWIIDDSFKGNYESYEEAINTLQQIRAKRKIVLMGNIQEPPGRQGPIYKSLGKKIGQCADKLIFAGDVFPRIKSGAIAGGMTSDQIIDAHHRIEEEVTRLKNDLREGDIVLIKARDTQKFRRYTLSLKGESVRCSVRYCNIKFDQCDVCPLLNINSEIFDNAYIHRLTRKG